MNDIQKQRHLFEGKSFDRVYHYHIRKTVGTSLNFAFFRLSGKNPIELYKRINRQFYAEAGGIWYAGWCQSVIMSGAYDYAFSHETAHQIALPPKTFTFTILRDPVARVLSHYKMLLHMRDNNPNHPGYRKETAWIESGFNGFLRKADRRELLRQLFMFSRTFDIYEAYDALGNVDKVLLLDDNFKYDFKMLQRMLGIELPYVQERVSMVEFIPAQSDQEQLRELLEPEYRLIQLMKNTLRKNNSPKIKDHESITVTDKHTEESSLDGPVKTAYRGLLQKKLSNLKWLKDDGRGRVKYAASLLRDVIKPHHKVLDMGCGRGTLGICLKRKHGMFGVDIVPEAVLMAREVYEIARVLNIDTEPLPWSDNTFDFVVCIDVIEHVLNPRVGLNEILRVLKPGGKLLLSTPNILDWSDELKPTRRFPKASRDPEPYQGGHIHTFTYRDIFDLLKSTGFSACQPVGPRCNDSDYEVKDRMVWVVGLKADIIKERPDVSSKHSVAWTNVEKSMQAGANDLEYVLNVLKKQLHSSVRANRSDRRMQVQQTGTNSKRGGVIGVRNRFGPAVRHSGKIGPEGNLVVFIDDRPRERTVKIAYGLKKSGIDVVLLHKTSSTLELGKFFVEIKRYNTPEEALKLARSYNPIAFHIFAAWNFDTAEHLIRNAPGVMIFDDYDVMAGMLEDEIIRKRHSVQIEKEKFCLESADGLVCRSLETQVAKRQLGYRLKTKRLLFLDGCWPLQPSNADKKISTGHCSFVYCGNLGAEIEGNYLLDFIRKGKRFGIHLHVYPSSVQKAGRMRELAQQEGLDNGRLVVHDPVPNDQLIQELRGYHYGLHAVTPNDPGIRGVYTPEKFEYASANKVFDYINAGLFVYVHNGRFMRSLVRRYGVGAHSPNIFDDLKKKNTGLQSIPPALDVVQNSPRLIKYYKEIRCHV